MKNVKIWIKSLAILVSAACLWLSCGVLVDAAGVLPELNLTTFEQMYYVDQTDGIAAYDALQTHYYQSSSNTYEFPLCYGGAYLDGSSLVVCLTEDTPANRQMFYHACETDDIVFREVAHSYATFRQVIQEIKAEDTYSNITYIGVSPIENCIDVYVDTAESLESMQQKRSGTWSANRQYVRYKLDTQEETLTIASGNKINNGSEAFSLCVWAELADGTEGFLTCGHPFYDGRNGSFIQSSASVYAGSLSNTVVGNTGSSLSDFYMGGGTYLDYAFVELTSSLYSPTTAIATGGDITSVKMTHPASGTQIFGYGSFGGMKCGCIYYDATAEAEGAGYIVIYDEDIGHGLGFDDLGYSGTIEVGDSGGPVYTIENNTRKLTGIQSTASSTSGATDGVAAVAFLAFDELNASIYVG